MSVVCAITEGHVRFHVLGCHQRPCSCEWPVQPPESMLMLCTWLKAMLESVLLLHMGLWPMVPTRARPMSVICAAT